MENVIGSQLGDTFIGNSSDNTFDGGWCLNAAYDTTDYEFATGGMVFNETAVGYDTFPTSTIVATGGGQGTDTLIDMTRIIGTSGDDTFNMITTNTPFLDGGAGNDTLSFQHATSQVSIFMAGTSGERSSNFNSIETLGPARISAISSPATTTPTSSTAAAAATRSTATPTAVPPAATTRSPAATATTRSPATAAATRSTAAPETTRSPAANMPSPTTATTC